MSVRVWRLLGRYLPDRNRRFVWLGVLSAVAGLLEAVVLVLAVRAAVGVAEGDERMDIHVPLLGDYSTSIPALLWCAAAAVVLSAGAGLLVSGAMASTAGRVLNNTRSATLRAYSKASWNRQARSRDGALQETVSNHAVQVSELSLSLIKMLSGAISLLAILGAALFVDVTVTAAVVAVGVVVVLVLRPLAMLTRKRAARFVDANTRFGETVAESSTLALEMRVFGVEDAETQRLVGASRQAASEYSRTRFASNSTSTLYRNAAILFLVVAIGVLWSVTELVLSTVGAVVLLMVRALSYAQQTHTASQRVNERAPNLVALDESVGDFVAAEERCGDAHVDRVGAVSLVGVSYAYGDLPALRDINLEIATGELLGVVGPSGSGKTTLAQVLLRLRPPTTGAVLVDGRPYEEISDSDWARLTSLVPQEPRLFAGTVAENIAFHRDDLTPDQIVDAAVRAHIAQEIEHLPNGFDTDVGPRGGTLSGGQRQRLAIARALVGSPQLLVLDEPTSALDVHSERLLAQTIAELRGAVTMVIVAHRLSTIAACERLLVLDAGIVSALGPYPEVADHPFFASINLESPTTPRLGSAPGPP